MPHPGRDAARKPWGYGSGGPQAAKKRGGSRGRSTSRGGGTGALSPAGARETVERSLSLGAKGAGAAQDMTKKACLLTRETGQAADQLEARVMQLEAALRKERAGAGHLHETMSRLKQQNASVRALSVTNEAARTHRDSIAATRWSAMGAQTYTLGDISDYPSLGSPPDPIPGVTKALFISCITTDNTPLESLPHADDAVLLFQHTLTRHGLAATQRYLSSDHPSDALPTKQEILESIEWLVGDAQPGECMVFAFVGHSANINGESSNGGVAPCDWGAEGVIKEEQLTEALVGTLPKGAKLTCFFDVAHGGVGMLLPKVWLRGRGATRDDSDFVDYSTPATVRALTTAWSEEPPAVGSLLRGLARVFDDAGPEMPVADLLNGLERAPVRGETTVRYGTTEDAAGTWRDAMFYIGSEPQRLDLKRGAAAAPGGSERVHSAARSSLGPIPEIIEEGLISSGKGDAGYVSDDAPYSSAPAEGTTKDRRSVAQEGRDLEIMMLEEPVVTSTQSTAKPMATSASEVSAVSSGNSLRGTARVTGASKALLVVANPAETNTITRFLHRQGFESRLRVCPVAEYTTDHLQWLVDDCQPGDSLFFFLSQTSRYGANQPCLTSTTSFLSSHVPYGARCTWLLQCDKMLLHPFERYVKPSAHGLQSFDPPDAHSQTDGMIVCISGTLSAYVAAMHRHVQPTVSQLATSMSMILKTCGDDPTAITIGCSRRWTLHTRLHLGILPVDPVAGGSDDGPTALDSAADEPPAQRASSHMNRAPEEYPSVAGFVKGPLSSEHFGAGSQRGHPAASPSVEGPVHKAATPSLAPVAMASVPSLAQSHTGCSFAAARRPASAQKDAGKDDLTPRARRDLENFERQLDLRLDGGVDRSPAAGPPVDGPSETRLREFCRRYCRDKLPTVASLLREHAGGGEAALLDSFAAQAGVRGYFAAQSKLAGFYGRVNPARMDRIDEILDEYLNAWDDLFRDLEERYGVPIEEEPASAAARSKPHARGFPVAQQQQQHANSDGGRASRRRGSSPKIGGYAQLHGGAATLGGQRNLAVALQYNDSPQPQRAADAGPPAPLQHSAHAALQQQLLHPPSPFPGPHGQGQHQPLPTAAAASSLFPTDRAPQQQQQQQQLSHSGAASPLFQQARDPRRHSREAHPGAEAASALFPDVPTHAESHPQLQHPQAYARGQPQPAFNQPHQMDDGFPSLPFDHARTQGQHQHSAPDTHPHSRGPQNSYSAAAEAAPQFPPAHGQHPQGQPYSMSAYDSQPNGGAAQSHHHAAWRADGDFGPKRSLSSFPGPEPEHHPADRPQGGPGEPFGLKLPGAATAEGMLSPQPTRENSPSAFPQYPPHRSADAAGEPAACLAPYLSSLPSIAPTAPSSTKLPDGGDREAFEDAELKKKRNSAEERYQALKHQTDAFRARVEALKEAKKKAPVDPLYMDPPLEIGKPLADRTNVATVVDTVSLKDTWPHWVTPALRTRPG